MNDLRQHVLDSMLSNYYKFYTDNNVSRVYDNIMLPLITGVAERASCFDLFGIQAMSSNQTKGYILENDDIVEKTLQRKIRRLSLMYTVEAQLSFNEFSEMLACMLQELVAEIHQELLATLDRKCSLIKVPESDGTKFNYFSRAIINNIENEPEMKDNTNVWIIVSQTILSLLRMESLFLACDRQTFVDLPLVGHLGKYKVYLDQYANDYQPILVGLKNSEVDSPIIWCPHSINSKLVQDPNTFEEILQFWIAYDLIESTKSNRLRIFFDIPHERWL